MFLVKDLSNKRRTLQEQPPPPKLWDSSEKQEKKISVNTVASIKGHKAVTNISSKKVKSQSPLQQKIDEALNGPGTMVDDDDINMLRVSDVDLPGTSVDGTTSETEPFDYKDINSEVETITKGMLLSPRRWQCAIKQESNFHYTRGITPKRVTSSGTHLRGLAPG